MFSYMCHKLPVALRGIIYCLHFSPHPTWCLWCILYQELHLHLLYWSFPSSLDFSSLFSSLSDIARVSQDANHQLHTNNSWVYDLVILWSRFLLTLNWILSARCLIRDLKLNVSKIHHFIAKPASLVFPHLGDEITILLQWQTTELFLIFIPQLQFVLILKVFNIHP